jgi:hypothetical protein
MANDSIKIEESEAGQLIRTVSRTIDGETVHMQGVVLYRAGLNTAFLVYAQDMGYARITTMFNAKEDNSQATTNSHARVLSRDTFPLDVIGADSTLEKTTQSTSDNTTVIDAARFFLPETVVESLNLDGATVKFCALVDQKSNNGSGTANLQQVIFKLRKLTANDTYTDIATATVTVNQTTTATSYGTPYSVVAYAPAIAGSTLDTDEQLVLEITTKGKISNASYICTHRLSFTVGQGYTFVELYHEEG